MIAEIDKDLLAQLFQPVGTPFAVKVGDILLSFQVAAKGNNHFSLRISDVEFCAGRIHSIYGTNGCGKTTLLRTLAGLQMPKEGFVTWSPFEPNPGLDQVLVTQTGPMPHWSVSENITLPMLNQGIKKQIANDRTKTLIELLGLQGFEARYAHQLSAGQQQRTVLARALSIAPKILFLDEIMSGQSEYWSARIAEILRFYASTGRMVVIVSHDPEWVLACTDRVTNIVSDTTDAVSTTQFFIGYDGVVQNWQAFRETRIRKFHEQSLGH
jgi:ABC-type nitrate/sulfonate/bicarbonate transport system ATPase subunit